MGARFGWLSVAMLAVATMSGCAIHSQGPIREVAYDFSDADFYDRGYAPAPESGDSALEGQYARMADLGAANVIDVGALPPGEAVDARELAGH